MSGSRGSDRRDDRRNPRARKQSSGNAGRSGGRRSAAGDAGGGDRKKPGRHPTAVGAGADLPRWLREEIVRTTKKDRREATLNLLSAAAGSFEEGRYAAARKKLIDAKELSSRAGAVRELLALSCYRLGFWQEALREIRTFRRITGDTTHMAVEMDCLRALGRSDDVHTTWQAFEELGGSPAAEAEIRVVYGSFLLDSGDAQNAWAVTRPRRLTKDAPEWEVRRWYVAARAAARLGDRDTARQIAVAIEELDPGLPGLEALHDEIAQLA